MANKYKVTRKANDFTIYERVEPNGTTWASDGWSNGYIRFKNGKTYNFTAKHYADASEFGIDKGRVSKFGISEKAKSPKTPYGIVYDRGWDTKRRHPDDPQLDRAMNEVVNHYDHLDASYDSELAKHYKKHPERVPTPWNDSSTKAPKAIKEAKATKKVLSNGVGLPSQAQLNSWLKNGSIGIRRLK